MLCENADAFGLAARAKEAVARRVHEMSFGTRADCESYMQRVQKAQAAVANQKQIGSLVKVKLERLRANCEYRNAADTVPTADSLSPPVTELDFDKPKPSPPTPGMCWRRTIGICTRYCCASGCRCAGLASASLRRACVGAARLRARPPPDRLRFARPHREGCPQWHRP